MIIKFTKTKENVEYKRLMTSDVYVTRRTRWSNKVG